MNTVTKRLYIAVDDDEKLINLPVMTERDDSHVMIVYDDEKEELDFNFVTAIGFNGSQMSDLEIRQEVKTYTDQTYGKNAWIIDVYKYPPDMNYPEEVPDYDRFTNVSPDYDDELIVHFAKV